MAQAPSKTAEVAATPVVRNIDTSDVLDALAQGMRDFRAAPAYGLFFGLVFAAGGWGILWLFSKLEIDYYVYPMITGFAMIAPFVAAGLYDVSRRLEKNEPLSFQAVLGSVFTAGGKDLGWMVLVTTFSYIIWMDIAIAVYLMFFGLKTLGFYEILDAIVTTPKGFAFFVVGNLIGAGLGLTVFSITAISFPLLFDRPVDFITAMITSVKCVLQNRRAMLTWCAVITGLMAISLLSIFVGLIVILPVLGHATWHLYRRAVEPV
jgi:uncharacterized membrane protein